MIVHKCDYCKEESFGSLGFAYIVKIGGNELEFCGLKCAINFLKKREKDSKKYLKEIKKRYKKKKEEK